MSARGAEIAPLIDHTLLKPDASRDAVQALCNEAVHYKFMSVCVNPVMVTVAAEILSGTGIKTCTTIGFPLGATTTDTKRFESERAIRDGAQELDMVLCISALKDKDFRYVNNDIAAVVKVAESKIVKVIIETCLLSNEEKRNACTIARDAGASFVKTSTGMSGGGATCEDIRLMRQVVGKDFGVKASGGIKTLACTLDLIAAGANRIGTSSGVNIVTASRPQPADFASSGQSRPRR
ncbi:MAG: deoxyribose-phosphate aldolase [Lentisphaerae bacterium]|nr:deoxyribose-phosphate aldolase [Lentisphaerota bacterium]